MFKKLFGKGDKSKTPRGFQTLTIAKINHITSDTVEVVLDVPNNLQSSFNFTPGQYVNFAIEIDGKEERRSYSICSGPNAPLAVAVKKVDGGKVSTWFNESAEEGAEIFVSHPEGNFVRPKEAKNIVAIAAGSGITPILSMAKAAEGTDVRMQLFYGSRMEAGIIFKSELDALTSTKTHYYLSGEEKAGFGYGRINKDAFTAIIKGNLDLLKADGFFLCGPEELIVDVVGVLALFGVGKEKIHYELFTTPTILKSEKTEAGSSFSGSSNVTAILDGEEITFTLDADGKAILDKVNDEGFDAPYSCKGGVCCTCKAKILEGNATMTVNYALTDKEVDEGYILTCQAHPASESLKITYDV